VDLLMILCLHLKEKSRDYMWRKTKRHREKPAYRQRDSRNRRIACCPIGPAPPNMRQLQVCHRNPVGIRANCRDGHLDGTG